MAEDIRGALGKLICDLNPYINIAGKTGDIDIYVDNPNTPPAAGGNRDTPADPCQIEVEVDDNYAGTYAGEWTFKGEAARIGKAVRIKYRYPVMAGANIVAWLEDYLLIGYEGSGN